MFVLNITVKYEAIFQSTDSFNFFSRGGRFFILYYGSRQLVPTLGAGGKPGIAGDRLNAKIDMIFIQKRQNYAYQSLMHISYIGEVARKTS